MSTNSNEYSAIPGLEVEGSDSKGTADSKSIVENSNAVTAPIRVIPKIMKISNLPWDIQHGIKQASRDSDVYEYTDNKNSSDIELPSIEPDFKDTDELNKISGNGTWTVLTLLVASHEDVALSKLLDFAMDHNVDLALQFEIPRQFATKSNYGVPVMLCGKQSALHFAIYIAIRYEPYRALRLENIEKLLVLHKRYFSDISVFNDKQLVYDILINDNVELTKLLHRYGMPIEECCEPIVSGCSPGVKLKNNKNHPAWWWQFDRPRHLGIKDDIAYLIAQKADVSQVNQSGDNMLTAHLNATSPNIHAVKTMLEFGVPFDFTNKAGNTPLQLLEKSEMYSQSVKEQLIQLFRNIHRLFEICEKANFPAELLEKKIEELQGILEFLLLQEEENLYALKNIRNHRGDTALSLACQNKVDPRIIDSIIKFGTNVLAHTRKLIDFTSQQSPGLIKFHQDIKGLIRGELRATLQNIYPVLFKKIGKKGKRIIQDNSLQIVSFFVPKDLSPYSEHPAVRFMFFRIGSQLMNGIENIRARSKKENDAENGSLLALQELQKPAEVLDAGDCKPVTEAQRIQEQADAQIQAVATPAIVQIQAVVPSQVAATPILPGFSAQVLAMPSLVLQNLPSRPDSIKKDLKS